MIVTVAGSAFIFAPNDAELGGINIELAAFDGTVGTGQFPIPDPSAAATMVTGRQLKVAQDFALLSDGFIIDNDRTRGPFRVGSQREYGVSVQDANALLGGFRVIRNRGAETDYARVIAFAGLDLPSADTTWVLNASTVTMPARVYDDDGGWSDLITDVIEFTGKTLFLHDKATGGRCLHYHLLTNGHTCGLTISDAVVQTATIYNPQAPDRQRTSVDLRNDVMGRDQTGRTHTVTDATSITAHDADGLQHQALIDFQADSQADLNAKTAAFLASSKDDYDVYTCTIGPLDGTALGKMRVGDLITVTSSVMGLSATVVRIAHLRYKFAGASNMFDAELEMGAPVRRRSRIKPALKNVVISPGTTGSGSGPCCPPWDGTGTPTTGQEVLNELVWTGDGTTVNGTTAYGFQSGTLRVWVAGLNVAGHWTEISPAAGTFSLDFAPTSGQTVRVNYTAA